MKPIQYRPGWRAFFGEDPYPFNLSMVEARDATAMQTALLTSILPPPPHRVLDAGCGHGRHARRLAEFGYQVIALDAVHANLRGLDATPGLWPMAGDFSRMPLANCTVDAVISMYTSLGYGHSVEPQLREARRVTRPGGRLVIDMINRRPLLRFAREPTGDGTGLVLGIRTVRRYHQFNVAFRAESVQLFAMGHPLFRKVRLARLLHQNGWKTERWFGDYEGNPYTPRSARLIVVACLAR